MSGDGTAEAIVACEDVAVAYGQPLPGVATRVRTSVAESVGAMTGLRVQAVDVTVTSP